MSFPLYFISLHSVQFSPEVELVSFFGCCSSYLPRRMCRNIIFFKLLEKTYSLLHLQIKVAFMMYVGEILIAIEFYLLFLRNSKYLVDELGLMMSP